MNISLVWSDKNWGFFLEATFSTKTLFLWDTFYLQKEWVIIPKSQKSIGIWASITLIQHCLFVNCCIFLGNVTVIAEEIIRISDIVIMQENKFRSSGLPKTSTAASDIDNCGPNALYLGKNQCICSDGYDNSSLNNNVNTVVELLRHDENIS